MPPLLREMFKTSSDARTTRRVSNMLTDIGGDAVLPLSIALPHLSGESQVVVCRVLGDIGYKHASPALLTLAQSDNVTPAVVQAASNEHLQQYKLMLTLTFNTTNSCCWSFF